MASTMHGGRCETITLAEVKIMKRLSDEGRIGRDDSFKDEAFAGSDGFEAGRVKERKCFFGDAVAEGKFLVVERLFGLVGIASVVWQVPLFTVRHLGTVKACA